MRLYATICGIREVNGINTPVSKGQGSNQHLEIIVMDGNREQKARFDITNDEDGFILDFLNYENGAVTRLIAQENTGRV